LKVRFYTKFPIKLYAGIASCTNLDDLTLTKIDLLGGGEVGERRGGGVEEVKKIGF